MRMLRGTDFGTDKNTLLLLYKSLKRSKIDYGAQIYSCASKTQFKSSPLDWHLGALSNTPGSDLELEAGIPPLSIRRQEQTLN
jgi:hypothetical protein